MIKIPFVDFGRVYMRVDIKPLGKTILAPIEFKVDTGADLTTISKEDLVYLGYDIAWINNNAIVFKDEEKPTTASGDKINAGYVRLPIINILGYEGKEWPF